MTRKELGEKLAQLRQEQGITIRRIADITHLSTRAVQAVEKGWYNVGIDTYLKLAQAVGAEMQIRRTQRRKVPEQ